MKNYAFYICFLALGIIGCNTETEPKVVEEKVVVPKMKTAIPEEGKEIETLINIPLDFSLQQFIPRNHAILDTTKGDLNLDGILDVVLVLKKKEEEKNSDMSDESAGRSVLLLIGKKDGH